MIFITLGSQKFQFNRLLEEVDRLIDEKVITEEVFAQTGYSNYEPHNYKFKNFLNRDEFDKVMQDSNLVITHGGTGAIIGAVKKSKKVIAVPRLARYVEHVDDHQIQLIDQFDEMGIIEPCIEIDKLRIAYHNSFIKKYKPYVSNTNAIIENIENYIGECKL